MNLKESNLNCSKDEFVKALLKLGVRISIGTDFISVYVKPTLSGKIHPDDPRFIYDHWEKKLESIITKQVNGFLRIVWKKNHS
ncbi:hypothetical protein [Polaribacter sp.]|uniref:hypothetical protein n=1 Tax=Polaribacter sp. TaxID=1920175 RepID=UPI003F6C45FB